MGAPKWPPFPQRSSRPGKAGALLDLDLAIATSRPDGPNPLSARRAPKWPHSPQRSSRPGKAGALLDLAGRRELHAGGIEEDVADPAAVEPGASEVVAPIPAGHGVYRGRRGIVGQDHAVLVAGQNDQMP